MGFMKSKRSVPPIIEQKIAPMPKLITDLPDTTQPGDLGKKSKKKGRDGTILTSVMGVEEPATISSPTLLGGMS